MYSRGSRLLSSVRAPLLLFYGAARAVLDSAFTEPGEQTRRGILGGHLVARLASAEPGDSPLKIYLHPEPAHRATASGRILDSSGEPVEGAFVAAWLGRETWAYEWRSTRTDDTGQFVLADLVLDIPLLLFVQKAGQAQQHEARIAIPERLPWREVQGLGLDESPQLGVGEIEGKCLHRRVVAGIAPDTRGVSQ